MLAKMLPKINYPVLLNAAKSIGIETDLPAELPTEVNNDLMKSVSLISINFLQNLFQIAELAFSVDVVEGELECPESGRVFKISEGIPNMLVNDEDGSGSP